jgi:hypothetical protein
MLLSENLVFTTLQLRDRIMQNSGVKASIAPSIESVRIA